jgi:hypothetical protein
MDEYQPPTEPSGALVPPPRVPPTALATVPPAPLEWRGEHEMELSAFAKFFDATLDVVDEVADSVAALLRIRGNG